LPQAKKMQSNPHQLSIPLQFLNLLVERFDLRLIVAQLRRDRSFVAAGANYQLQTEQQSEEITFHNI